MVDDGEDDGVVDGVDIRGLNFFVCYYKSVIFGRGRGPMVIRVSSAFGGFCCWGSLFVRFVILRRSAAPGAIKVSRR